MMSGVYSPASREPVIRDHYSKTSGALFLGSEMRDFIGAMDAKDIGTFSYQLTGNQAICVSQGKELTLVIIYVDGSVALGTNLKGGLKIFKGSKTYSLQKEKQQILYPRYADLPFHDSVFYYDMYSRKMTKFNILLNEVGYLFIYPVMYRKRTHFSCVMSMNLNFHKVSNWNM